MYRHALTNIVCLYYEILIQKLHKKQKNNTRLCVDIFSLSTFVKYGDRLPLNKPDRTISINNTSKYLTKKYIMSANDTWLVVSDDDYQLKLFELFLWNNVDQ